MGLGYIGLPTAIIAAKSGVEIVGVDVNEQVVKVTNEGHLHIIEPGMEEMLQDVIRAGRFKAYTQPQEADAFFIVVPTPFKNNHQPDISFVESATRMVLPYLREGNLFVIESTSPVGTTEHITELIFTERPELKDKISIAYCPERVLPGNVIYELVHNDRVIGGIDEVSSQKAKEFYGQFVKGELHTTNSRTAEMCKLTENASRDVQIAFANELSFICDKAGINVWELIELANKHPRVNILQPGCGVGGHCIAVDPYFITSEFPNDSRLMTRARDVNNLKPLWCVDKVRRAIFDFQLNNHRVPSVALMGLAFKPNIDDLRESPASAIVARLMQFGKNANIMVVEPNIVEHKNYKLTSYREAYEAADIVVFLVNHREFASLNYRSDVEVFDFCGVFKK